MRKLLRIVIIAFILLPFAAHAGFPGDSLYIHVFKQNYNIQGNIYTNKINFSLNPSMHIDTIDSRKILYEPNIGYYLGLSLSYKMFAMSLSFAIPGANNNDSVAEKTSSQNVSVSVNERMYGGTAYYEKYKGFFLDNPGIFSSLWHGNNFPQRNDIEYTTYGINTYYLFNNTRFSMKAIMSQSERQQRTAGTFLVRLDGCYSTIHADSSIIPKSDEKYYQDMRGLHNMNFYDACLLGGYAHCTVIRKDYYICPMLYSGPGVIRKLISSNSGDFETDNLFLKVDFKFAAGYNAKVSFLGVLFDSESDFMPAKFINFKTTVFSISFFVGYRFW